MAWDRVSPRASTFTTEQRRRSSSRQGRRASQLDSPGRRRGRSSSQSASKRLRKRRRGWVQYIPGVAIVSDSFHPDYRWIFESFIGILAISLGLMLLAYLPVLYTKANTASFLDSSDQTDVDLEVEYADLQTIVPNVLVEVEDIKNITQAREPKFGVYLKKSTQLQSLAANAQSVWLSGLTQDIGRLRTLAEELQSVKANTKRKMVKGLQAKTKAFLEASVLCKRIDQNLYQILHRVVNDEEAKRVVTIQNPMWNEHSQDDSLTDQDTRFLYQHAVTMKMIHNINSALNQIYGDFVQIILRVEKEVGLYSGRLQDKLKESETDAESGGFGSWFRSWFGLGENTKAKMKEDIQILTSIEGYQKNVRCLFDALNNKAADRRPNFNQISSLLRDLVNEARKFTSKERSSFLKEVDLIRRRSNDIQKFNMEA